MGNEQDVLITHVADTGINITTTAATAGIINLGNDDDVNDDSIDLIMHDAAEFTMYDENDDNSAKLAVTDNVAGFTLTGDLIITLALMELAMRNLSFLTTRLVTLKSTGVV
jgi:hypothetical protein